MVQIAASPERLLKASYEELGFSEGELFEATDSPKGIKSEDWLNKGEWLALAKAINAEKIFFVNNNPIIVFAKSETDKHHERFRQIWNMARPPLLFLASPGELAVYDLTVGPAKNQKDWEQTLNKRQLARAETILEVLEKLNQFRREQVETGYIFGEERFGETQRADRALISDLQYVRDDLVINGLKPKYAHSLIGRSIFIRYLEDRGIITEEYFKKVTRGKPEWQELLKTDMTGSFVEPELAECLYFRVLQDKEFTYALFERLARDFNGDMFPDIKDEKKHVTAKHLNMINDFLCGSAEGQQLFFFAYKFDIIPIELISSIYEEFYTTENGSGRNGTHYTPPALVEFLLNQVLTPDCLQKNPRIYDIACGSGIFIVEAFRRIVRYRVYAQGGRRLSDIQLRKIIREQLAGIDINEEAVRVAAFSLYLAFLHYQRPPDILEQIKQGKKLPNLKYEKRKKRDTKQHYDILLAANTFDVNSKISSSDEDVLSRFSKSCADIIVGNPPWGSPGKSEKETQSRDAVNTAMDWCKRQEPELSVGDREWSQAFIHKTIELLKETGKAGLLVSSGVLFKSKPENQLFRRQWLSRVELKSMVNFAHVRDIFFQGKNRLSGAQSPFISVCFEKKTPNEESLFEYWSAKKTAVIGGTQSVILSGYDRAYLRQSDAFEHDDDWKIYWWGRHRDKSLVQFIKNRKMLKECTIQGSKLTSEDFGRGFEKTGDKNPSGELQKYATLSTRQFNRYGLLNEELLEEVPEFVHRKGNIRLYEGVRLLIKRGITEKNESKGQIIARLALADTSFCFKNSIHGVRLPDSAIWEGKVILAIFWSSLARYYFWLISGSWMWHNEIHLEDVLQMPIRLPESEKLRERIIEIVDQLRVRGIKSQQRDIYDTRINVLTHEETEKLEKELDEAIFELYELNEAERDLIRDMCDYGLDLFYNNIKSDAVRPVEIDRSGKDWGVLGDIRSGANGIKGYIHTFLKIWNRELEPGGEFCWRVICPGWNIPMIAVVFSTKDKKEPPVNDGGSDVDQWKEVLEKLDNNSMMPFVSKRIYIDGIVRSVSDTEIMIIKRNERRLWTRSMAREDAEATLLQAMNMKEK